MKNVYKIFAALAVAAAASSCVYEIEDVFPQNASERVNGKALECQELLTSSLRGWLVQYYPSANQEFGGCTYVMVFDPDGKVTVASELADKASDTAVSHYSITTSSSVVLTFDTYNEYIHFWSDPDMFSGNEYGGDFELAFVSGDENRLVFRGTKTGNRIVFTALTEDQDMETIIQGIIDYKNKFNTEYDIVAGDNIPIASLSASSFLYGKLYNVLTYLPEGAEDWEAVDYPFSFTADGISLYEPVEVAGETFQDFVFEDDGSLVALDETGEKSSVRMTGHQAETYMPYEGFIGSYTLVYYNGSRTMPLEFEAAPDGASYVVTGAAYPMTVSWTPYGYLTLNAQLLSSSGIYLCSWALDPATGTGNLTWDAATGFNLVPISSDPLALEFVDNGAWQPLTSLIMYNVLTGASVQQLVYLVGLVKND